MPKNNQYYRLLNEGETIREGDEYFNAIDEAWRPDDAGAGVPVAIGDYPTRRALSFEPELVLELLEDLLERMIRPPDASCSCHLSPPCCDCVEYAGLRETIELAEEVLTSTKERGAE
jgi:hypothetical protein